MLSRCQIKHEIPPISRGHLEWRQHTSRLRSSSTFNNTNVSFFHTREQKKSLLHILENGNWLPSNHNNITNPYSNGIYIDKRARACFQKDINKNALKYEYSLPIATIEKVNPSVPIMFAGDSLLGQLYVEFIKFGNIAKYHKAYILVDSYTLKPMAVDSSCYENHTSQCPPYSRDRKDDKWSFASSMEDLTWTKTFSNIYKKNSKNFFLVINIGHHWWKESHYASTIKKCSTSNGIRDAYVILDTKICDAFYKYQFMVKYIFDFLEDQHFKGTLIYITSPPGYPKCSANLPVNILPSIDKLPYNWNKPLLNEFKWEDIYRKSDYKFDFYVLNITRMSMLRGDAHPDKDCLHFCPGTVPIAWARMLTTFINSWWH